MPLTLDDCWEFFSKPTNLQMITPQNLAFKMLYPEECSKMYSGQIIAYTIRSFGISMEWITEITQVQEFNYFIDEQRFGPYKFWHHEHRFNSIPNGVEMIDTIYYKLPLGPIGKLLHSLKVKRIFKAFGSYIHKMSNFREGCSYNVLLKVGEKACPFNYLYWDFLLR
jgi:ligand-binding SRPBCC domain-containing protein